MTVFGLSSPAPAELPEPANDPIAQAIAEFEARGAEEGRRYVPGELARQYRQLGAHEGYARLQHTVANAWHEDHADYVEPTLRESIYPTMRERARSNPAAIAAAERDSALRATMTLNTILAAGKQAMAHYAGDDRAARVSAWAIGSQIYDMLHPVQTHQSRPHS